MSGFFNFIRENLRLLAFGFACTFFSAFGQTFFISLSGAEIRDAFGLSHGDFGFVYACATLSSAALLIWVGKLIDRINLPLYTVLVCVGLGLAALGMAGAEHVLILYLVIFGLRFCGQGLLSHISIVSMARYFDRNRGKALSLSTVGHPAGEALFPTLVVLLIAWVGWRQMWGGIGLAVIVLLVPVMLWLLKGQKERDRRQRIRDAEAGAAAGWTRGQVLRDPRFYVLLPSYLAISFVSTGIFFHQVHLTESKGWSLELFAGLFVVYALCQSVTALVAGGLVDRFRAVKVMGFYLLPAMAGLISLALSDAPWAAAGYMVFAGISTGLVAVVHGAVWAEIYGTAHLGAIKAMGTALMVFSTALSPPLLGVAIDAGVSMEAISLACLVYLGIAAFLCAAVFPRIKAPAAPAVQAAE